MTRTSFTTRLHPDLTAALDERVKLESRSRNWGIEQAVRAWLLQAGTATDDTHKSNGSGDARGASAEPVGERARRDRPDLALVGTETEVSTPAASVSRHLHHFTEEVPDSRRGIRGTIYATYACHCGVTVERKAR